MYACRNDSERHHCKNHVGFVRLWNDSGVIIVKIMYICYTYENYMSEANSEKTKFLSRHMFVTEKSKI